MESLAIKQRCHLAALPPSPLSYSESSFVVRPRQSLYDGESSVVSRVVLNAGSFARAVKAKAWRRSRPFSSSTFPTFSRETGGENKCGVLTSRYGTVVASVTQNIGPLRVLFLSLSPALALARGAALVVVAGCRRPWKSPPRFTSTPVSLRFVRARAPLFPRRRDLAARVTIGPENERRCNVVALL